MPDTVHSCAYCGGGPVENRGDTCSDECANTLARWTHILERLAKCGAYFLDERQDWSMKDDVPQWTVKVSLIDLERFLAGEDAPRWKENCGLYGR